MLNRFLILFSLFLAFAFLTLCFLTLGENLGENFSYADEPKAAELTAKLLVSSYKYKEPSVGISIGGTLFGPDLDFKFNFFEGRQYLLTNVQLLSGQPTYNGAMVNLVTGEKTPISYKHEDSIYTLQVRYGLRIPPSQLRLLFSPILDISAGWAYRYLDDRGSHESAYEREQTYLYLPARAELEFPVSSSWKFLTDLETDIFLAGHNKTHLGDIAPGASTASLQQTSGQGYKIAVGARKHTDQRDFTADIFYRTWNIGKSNVTQALGQSLAEPANTTSELGLGVGAVF